MLKSTFFIRERLENIAKYCAVACGFFIPISTAMMTVTMAATIILILVSGNWHEKVTFIKNSPALYFPVLLYVWIVVGMFCSDAFWNERLHEARTYYCLLGIPLLAYLFREEKWRRWALYSFIAAMLLTLLLSYLKFYFHIVIYSSKLAGPENVFRDHISMGILSVFFVFLLCHFCQRLTGRWRYLCMLTIALIVWYLFFMSKGRTAYGVFFAALMLFCWQLLRWKGIAIGVVVMGIVLALALNFSSVFQQRTFEVAHDVAADYQAYRLTQKVAGTGSASLRKIAMHSGLILIKQHPILGVGTGNFFSAVKQTAKLPISLLSSNAYNDVIYITAQSGLIGLVLLLAMYVGQWLQTKRLPAHYAAYAQLLLVIMVVGGLFNCVLHDVVEAYFYTYFAALCFAAYQCSDTA